jgi:hypothetical protein
MIGREQASGQWPSQGCDGHVLVASFSERRPSLGL